MIGFFQDVNTAGNYESFHYSFNQTGFTARFFKDGRFDTLSCGNYGLNVLQSGEVIGASYSADGFSWLQNSYEAGSETFYYSYGYCQEASFVQDCSFSRGSQDLFLYLSGGLLLLFTTLLFFSIFFIKLRFILCLITKGFFGEKIFDLMKFCNPLNGRFAFKWKGECFYTFFEGEPEVFDDYGSGDILLNFKNYSFRTSRNKIVIFKNDNFLSVVFEGDLSEMKIRQVRQLLMATSININNWPLNNRFNHFVGMEEFIGFLTNENINLQRKTLDRNAVILNLSFEDFLVDFSSLNKETVKTLISHNLFFFGFLNFPCLLNASIRKFSWADRPNSSGNSQWKRYTNDVAKFLTSKNIRVDFFQSKNAGQKITDSLVKAINHVAKGNYRDVKISDVCDKICSFEPKKKKDSSLREDFPEDIFEKVCEEICETNSEVFEKFTSEEWEGIKKCERSHSIPNLISSSERSKELLSNIRNNEEKLKDFGKIKMSLVRANNDLASLNSKQKRKAEAKWGSTEEVGYKMALLNDDIKAAEAEIKYNHDLKKVREKCAEKVFTNEYLYLQDPNRRLELRSKLKSSINEEADTPFVGNNDPAPPIEDVAALSFYCSILKRSKNKKEPKKLKFDYRNPKNIQNIIEIKNRYSCLYPDDVEEIFKGHNDCRRRTPNQKTKNCIETTVGEVRVSFKNCVSLKRGVHNAKVEGAKISGNSKIMHEMMCKAKNISLSIERKTLNLSTKSVIHISDIKKKIKDTMKAATDGKREQNLKNLKIKTKEDMRSLITKAIYDRQREKEKALFQGVKS
jgi:hypothetical protein